MQSELFDCPICCVRYQSYNNIPKIVSTCGHTLCVICLDSLLTKPNPQCPLDRKPFDKSLAKAADFPTNILVLQLLDEAHAVAKANIADKDCKLCETHKEPANMVCLTDKCTICKYCADYGSHKGHSVLHVNDAKGKAEEKKLQIEGQIKTFDSEFQPVYQMIKVQREDTKQAINKKFTKLAALLREREEQLYDEVENYYSLTKMRVDDKLEERLSLKQTMIEKALALDDMEFNKEFFEALEFDSKEKVESEGYEPLKLEINETTKKVDSFLEELEQGVVSTNKKYDPLFPKVALPKLTARNSPNLFFYQDKIPSQPGNMFLKDFHEKWPGKYNQIQTQMGGANQWLFPNFFRSRVNKNAQKLQEHEAQIFRTDPEIAKKLVKSYSIIIDFFGWTLKNDQTGELVWSPTASQRMKVIHSVVMDLLVLRRILTFLNNVGLRRYAIELVNTLEREIYGQVGGYQKFVNKDPNFDIKAFQKAAFKDFGQDKNFFSILDLYGDHRNDPERIKNLEKNCFCRYPEGFVDSVYFQKQ